MVDGGETCISAPCSSAKDIKTAEFLNVSYVSSIRQSKKHGTDLDDDLYIFQQLQIAINHFPFSILFFQFHVPPTASIICL